MKRAESRTVINYVPTTVNTQFHPFLSTRPSRRYYPLASPIWSGKGPHGLKDNPSEVILETKDRFLSAVHLGKDMGSSWPSLTDAASLDLGQR